MCCETSGGIVDFFGKIRIRPNKFEPIALPELHYVIFNDIGDILGLKYKAVCADFEIETKGKTADEALDGLTNAINHYIDLAIKDFTREKAYSVLMKERTASLSSRGIAFISYYEAEAHRIIYINEEIKHRIKLMSMSYYSDLFKSLIFITRLTKANIYASKVAAL
jgi:hypothetical protein